MACYVHMPSGPAAGGWDEMNEKISYLSLLKLMLSCTTFGMSRESNFTDGPGGCFNKHDRRPTGRRTILQWTNNVGR